MVAASERTLVGIATFDSAIQFYSLKAGGSLPQMLVVTDTSEVYVPDSAPIVSRWGPRECMGKGGGKANKFGL